MTNTGATAHRYRIGSDPQPYRQRFVYERRGGHLLIGVRLGKHMHVLRLWRQQDGR
jgi:hypothetical protein